jgi:hypothetical protein
LTEEYRALTVKELKVFLKDCNDDDEVYAGEGTTDHSDFTKPSGVVIEIRRNKKILKDIDV